MKYKLPATLMIAFMLILPIVGFWHPPIPPYVPSCTYMGTLINDEFEWTFDGSSGDFVVTVYIAQVTDMYGYEFIVDYDPDLFRLVSWNVATDIWETQTIIFNGTVGAGLYKQVVIAMPPSTGATGDFKLVDLNFHIIGFPCPGMPATGGFSLTAKVANSCSGEISLCNAILATYEFTVGPKIMIVPAAEVNSKVGDTFTVSVVVKYASGMSYFDVVIKWKDYYHALPGCWLNGKWTTLLTADMESVVLNTDLFDPSTAYILVHSRPCGVYFECEGGYVLVRASVFDPVTMIDPPIDLPNPADPVWLFNVTFTKCDPWYCGAQPRYKVDTRTHEYIVENASTSICFSWAKIKTKCGLISPKQVSGKYTFAPIPGDLNGDGLVDVVDLMIETSYYGRRVSCEPWDKPAGGQPNGYTYYYDLNHNNVIDVYDLIIVAKNVGRDTP